MTAHGYLGTQTRQKLYLFYIYKRYYPSPLSSSLSTPRAPPAVLKQSLHKRKNFVVMTPADHLD